MPVAVSAELRGNGESLGLRARFERISRASSAAVVALGAVVLLGWIFDVNWLRSIAPSFATMKPNTALLFVAIGAALWHARESGNRRIRLAAAAGVLAVAVATESEHVFGVDLGIDELLFHDSAGPHFARGRMAPTTALNFALLATSLLLLGPPQRLRVCQLLGVPVALVSFVSFCGYLYGATSLYGVGLFASVAVHTTIGFLVALFALLMSRPEGGIMSVAASETSAGALLRRILPAITVIPVALAWLRLQGQAAGLYDTTFGVAILTTGNVLLLSVVAWSIASSLHGSELRQKDAEHQLASREQALRSSEAKYRDLFETLPDMCLSVDVESQIVVDCNETLAQKLGYSKAEIVGHPVGILYHPEGAQLRAGARDLLKRVGEVREAERLLRRKDGTKLEVEASVTARRDESGRFHARGVWRDISTRKQRERDEKFLSDLGELLRQSSDADGLLFKVAERVGVYLNVTRAAFNEIDPDRNRIVIRRDFHRDVASMQGTYTLSDYGAEVAAEQEARKTTVIADTGTDPRTAHRYPQSYAPLQVRAIACVPLHRDGRWVATLSVCDGSTREWSNEEVALLQETAERTWLWVEHVRLTAALREKEARDMLRRSEERFRILVDAIKDYAIFLLDAEGRVITWNEGARQIKGYESAEILGRHFSVFYTAEDSMAGHPAEVLAHAAGEGRYEEEGWRVRKDGSRFWASVLLTALYEKNGELRGFAKVTRDVTARREAEESLRQNRADLAASLKEREVLLQEVHHRVKNNLQVISSLINMQARQLGDRASRGALEECKTRVEAIALIHEKLYQSKDYARVPFSEYARSLARNIFQMSGASQSSVKLEVDMDGLALAVDKAIPCGLIMNELITNALKHAFPENRAGIVRIELRKAEPKKVLLAVGDDGVGMPADFEPAQSSSLGLQLVTTLVEQLDGQLDVVHDGGTKFKILFPVEGAA